MNSEVPGALPSPGADVVESAIAVLRGHGSRITPARRLLLTALREPGHHSAGQIAAAVRAQAPGVHLTTVYRNLEELERLHVVDRTYVNHGPATYHLSSAAHGHLACEACGSIAELPGEAFRALTETAMSLRGFEINPARFAVPGRCAVCR
ncbi:MAG TPA: Fur family transcriptional regulator [Streptosporangiaceae bacterium]|nr:Fur family transcriptional regulator [Streptosporangiaceae bacterium]